jgi:hypothetical protein
METNPYTYSEDGEVKIKENITCEENEQHLAYKTPDKTDTPPQYVQEFFEKHYVSQKSTLTDATEKPKDSSKLAGYAAAEEFKKLTTVKYLTKNTRTASSISSLEKLTIAQNGLQNNGQ